VGERKVGDGPVGTKEVGAPYPYCYLQLSHELLANVLLSSKSTDPIGDQDRFTDNLWIGNRFALSEPTRNQLDIVKGSIIPTDIIYHVGLHRSSACKLKYPYNGCKDQKTHILSNNSTNKMSEFCYKNGKDVHQNDKNSPNIQYFDEPVLEKRIKQIDRNDRGGLYRIMIDEDDMVPMRNPSTNLKRNEYSLKHFPLVLRELKKRKLDLLINIPPFMDEKLILSSDWIDYDLIYQTRNKMGSLFPGVLGVGR